MRILVNAISAQLGGIITYTTNLMRSLADRGLDSTFAVSPEFPRQEFAETMVVRANSYSAVRRVVWEQTVWRHMVAKHRPDVLYSSANFGVLFCPVPQVLLVREGGLFDPFYLTNIAPTQSLDGTFTRSARRRLIIASAKKAEHIFMPTETMREIFLAWVPALESRSSVNNFGTLTGLFSPPKNRRTWREDGILRVLYVSVYYPHKNPAVVVEAVKTLNEENITSHATITMSLDEMEGTRGGAFDHFSLSAGLERGQVTLGRHPYAETPQLYDSHDVFVFPSVSETFGHPLAEAMSAAVPVVASDTKQNREVLGDTALYFEPFSQSDLRRQLMVLDGDPELRRQLVEKGRERVLSRLGWEDHVDRLLEIFAKVIHDQQNG